MRSIAVLGANGQVGMEVCLFLSVLEDTRVIPIVRSELGAAYLARCGFDCRVGSTTGAEETGSLLAGADLVVDLTAPRGQTSQALGATREVVASSIRHAPPGVPFVYMSSTMAFGMPPDARAYKRHLVARTPYASLKRCGERLTRRLARTHRRPAFVLRLGQVHGELQAVSREMKLGAGSQPVLLRQGGETASDTLFCATIAMALRTYTLLESPEWSWKELYEFYGRVSGVPVRIVPDAGGRATRSGMARDGLHALGSLGARLLSRHKDLLNAQILPPLSRLPPLRQLDLRLRGPYLRRRAAAEIRAGRQGVAPRCHDGPVPGRRLRSLGDSRSAMTVASRRVRRILDERLGPESHNFASD
jgi:nucleoside-diphosphate-sugar epimerase